jgi:hypothetical protein
LRDQLRGFARLRVDVDRRDEKREQLPEHDPRSLGDLFGRDLRVASAESACSIRSMAPDRALARRIAGDRAAQDDDLPVRDHDRHAVARRLLDGRAGASAANAAPANSEKARKRATNTRNLRRAFRSARAPRARFAVSTVSVLPCRLNLVVHQVVAAVDDQRIADDAIISRCPSSRARRDG